jgi:hypothetical protein
LAEDVIGQIHFEMEQEDRLFEFYADLLTGSKQREPNLVEMTAVGAVLHSFYNGIESIFLAVAKEVDHGIPTGADWHRSLLTRMTQATPNRHRVGYLAEDGRYPHRLSAVPALLPTFIYVLPGVEQDARSGDRVG